MKIIKFIWIILACLTFLSSTQLKAQFDNSPSDDLVIPEAVWARATGGGTWVTSLQLSCGAAGTGGNVVAYFNYGGGSFRGPVVLMNNPGYLHSVLYENILSYMDGIDTGFSYFGRAGSLTIYADNGIRVTAVARISNGNNSKTLPGLNDVTSNCCASLQVLAVAGLANTSVYRAILGLANPSQYEITVDIYVHGAYGEQIGSVIQRYLPGFGFIALNPFVECGRPWPAYSFSYSTIQIWSHSGPGRAMAIGATTNNTTNDPGAHIAVNWLDFTGTDQEDNK